MLPIPIIQVAMQECVGDNAKKPKLTTARPAAKVRFAVDVEVRAEPTAEPTKQDQLHQSRCEDLPGSETTGENSRCSTGENIYSPSHLISDMYLNLIS
jgi:hypothetical protein